MNSLDLISRTLARYSDDCRRIEMTFASCPMIDVMKEVQSLEHLCAASRMMATAQWEHRELARMHIYEDMAKRMVHFEDLAARLAAADTIKLSVSDFTQKTLAWDIAATSLLDRMNDIGLLAQREALSTRLLEAPNTYVAFVQNTIDRLATDITADTSSRLRASLNLAQHQLLEIANGVNAIVTVPEDNEEPDTIRVLDAPYEQQNELLKCKYIQDENDVVALIGASPTAQATERARRALNLVTLCNEAGKTSVFGVEIFKPTTRLLTVFNDLPWLSPTDRCRFGDVVDCLYFIFYEAAGKDHLRFLDKHGGPLTEADCGLIWCIKHLRNKWSRHDADHGKEKDIQKSWKELALQFRWLGLAEHPTTPQHFQQLHHQLLLSAEDFLTSLLRKLKLESGN